MIGVATTVQWSVLLGVLLFFLAAGTVPLGIGWLRKDRCYFVYGFFCLVPAAMFLYAYWRLV